MSLVTNISFTDPQGTVFTDATFGVSYATEFLSETKSLQRDMSDMTTMIPGGNTSKNVNVQYYYWADETKRLEGKSPYILANMNDGTRPPTMTFDFDAAGDEYIGMDTDAICLHYLQNVILAG